jgi:hypothetical protein
MEALMGYVLASRSNTRTKAFEQVDVPVYKSHICTLDDLPIPPPKREEATVSHNVTRTYSPRVHRSEPGYPEIDATI